MKEPSEKQPFEQRKSQNLHFSDYAKGPLFWASLPLIGGLATLLGGYVSKKYFNNKIWPLDGSPTIVQTLWEKGFSHVSTKAIGQKLEIGEVERLGFITSWLPEEKRLNVTHHIWNFAKGVELAVIPTAYHFWRRAEKQRLDLKPAHDRLKKLDFINPNDAELREDNASLKRQLDAARSQASPSPHAGQIVHHGKVAQAQHEHTVAN